MALIGKFFSFYSVWKKSEDLKSKAGTLYHKYVLAGPPVLNDITGEKESQTVDALAGSSVVPIWRNKLEVGIEYLFSGVRFERKEFNHQQAVTMFLGRTTLAECDTATCL